MKTLQMWLSLRPDADQMNSAMEQMKTLTILVDMQGLNPDYADLKDVLEWAWLSHRVPFTWLEKKVQEEVHGSAG